MNSLIWLAIALALIVFFLMWFGGILRSDGASRQKDKNREKVNEWRKKQASDRYDGRIGTKRFSVRNDEPWGKDTNSSVERRVERPDKNDSSRKNGNGTMPNR